LLRTTLIAAGASLSLLPVGAQAAELPVQVLEPTSNWTLHYDPEQCALMRDFGPEDNRLRLQIESYGSPTDFRFLLAGKPVPPSRDATGQVRYSFPNDTVARAETTALEGTTGREVAALSFSGNFRPYDPNFDYQSLSTGERLEFDARPKPTVPEFEREVDRLTIEIDQRVRLDLLLGGMEKPLQAMRKCIEELQASWGLVPATESRLSRYPMPLVSSVRRVQRTYPRSMLLQGASAFVPVRIMVDAQGEASGCVVQVPGIERAFSQAVCDNLARKFAPALDEAGNPVAGIYRTSVIYMIGR
jgi:hypothetical protein